MDINQINSRNNYYTKTTSTVKTSIPEDTKSKTETTTEQTKPNNQDTFIKNNSSTPVTYKPNKKLNNEQVKALQNAEAARVESFNKMIQSMVVKQGQASNLKLFGMDLFVTPEQSAQAAASIAEGGEYSINAVADRIMNMAYALSGGDSSKIELLRNAVEKGFEAAGAVFGGELPEISQQTHTEVMKRFDDWANQANKAPETNATDTEE